jgi:arylsulfatase A-like enzyme
MKKLNDSYKFLKALICVFAVFYSTANMVSGQEVDNRPNIILILADDLGFADLACTGSDLYQTPNIDMFAGEAMYFSQSYSAHPTCMPSRMAIQTGKYPARLGAVSHGVLGGVEAGPHDIPAEEVTIGEALQKAGYTTCHIGKWHLGDLNNWPTKQGYDTCIATNERGMPASYFYPYKKSEKSPFDVPDLADSDEEDFLTDKLADKAIDFIQQNRHNPFFINLCFYAVHTPIQAKEEKIEKYRQKLQDGMLHNNPEYAGLVEHLDDNVGKIMNAIQEEGIADNTIVLFFSDNGGLIDVTSNYPLRDGKGSLYEGGTREPLFIKWPGITEGGKICHEPVIGHDFYPTIMKMAGINEKVDVDGIDITPLLRDPEGKVDREALHWLSFPIAVHHFANPNRKPGGAIVIDEWKLIELMETPQGLKHHFELYNLKEDPGEQFDISSDYPEKVEQLKNKMMNWRKSVNAPAYDMEKQYGGDNNKN